MRKRRMMSLALLIPLAVVCASCSQQAQRETSASRSTVASAERKTKPKRGNQLAFSVVSTAEDTPGDLWLWSESTGKAQRLAKGYLVHGICFSPDGKRLAFLGYRLPPKRVWSRDLWVLDMSTRRAKQVTNGFFGDGAAIAWRPGTEQVAAARNHYYRYRNADVPGDDGLWLIDARTGTLRQVIGGSDSEVPTNTDPRFNGDGSMLASTRDGRYAAVLEMGRPQKWFRLDKPKHMNPTFISDWAWMGRSRRLIIGAMAASGYAPRVVRGGRSLVSVQGPGGVWEWDVEKKRAFSPPLPDRYEPKDLAETSATPLFGQKQTIYAVAPSRDGKRVAYVSDSGVWVHDFKTRKSSQLVKGENLPRFKDAREVALEASLWTRTAGIGWSPDDRYLYVRISRPLSDTLRVIDVARKRVIVPIPDQDNIGIFPAWRPDGRKGSIDAPN